MFTNQQIEGILSIYWAYLGLKPYGKRWSPKGSSNIQRLVHAFEIGIVLGLKERGLLQLAMDGTPEKGKVNKDERWITLSNGSHVKINKKTGQILSGAGPENVGKTFDQLSREEQEQVETKSVESETVGPYPLKAYTLEEFKKRTQEGTKQARDSLKKLGSQITVKDAEDIGKKLGASMSGKIPATLGGKETALVCVTKNTVRETIQHSISVDKHHGVSIQESVKRSIEVLSELPNLMRNNVVKQDWENAIHHKDKEVATLQAKSKAVNADVYLDVFRSKNTLSWKTAHYASRTDTDGYRVRKKKEIGEAMDQKTNNDIVLWRIRF